ncbi:pyridoxal phosphate-dependent aminotransferase [Bradyrhizobium jicamae]|uniref:Aminotransferase n=1 Tax=Bradyrhizobium jicamae TaxID=280332 RepID=A0ABS5FQ34_9BRAD|nr:pyridoxal phosphate-dependent aminotransferase [Bradyrhizobium jicamae]MBR0798907.1 pyridoxal phosphate-dependent aminotransferase [Bradyrhizobium jicamae]MBR0938605.1 pyridoxal phosphate-dependent aminotransferase [Bradyrhizobium jicamae]
MTVQEKSFRPARRIGAIGVSEILKIGAAAQRLKREGRPVIVLGAGEPDFDTPDHVKAAAEAAIRAGQTKYTILDGTMELKAAIADKFRRENGLHYESCEITAGAGAKQVIHNAFMATLSPGDEVILAAPYWTSYADMVKIADGVPVDVLCREDNGFRLDAEDLERAITPRTRWLLLNSPSNPTGAAYSAAQLRPILDVLMRHPQVWLMADDIYEHLTYDGAPFVTAAALEPGLKPRTLTVNGVSKAYAMTGWRVGYGGGPRELIAAMAVVQSQSTTNPSSVSQAAAIAALSGPQDILIGRREAFQRRRDLVVDALNAIDGVSCRRPEGAFYTFASCAGLIGRRTHDGMQIDSDSAFCRYLLERHDVAVVPGSCFGLAPYFRLSYATSDQNLRDALDRIANACRELS